MAKYRQVAVQGAAGAPSQNGASVSLLSLYDQESFALLTIGASDRLKIGSIQLNSTEAAATLSAVGAHAAGDTITAKAAAANTYTIAGDHTVRYGGYTHVITVGASTENGSHAITNVAAAAGPTTVITVSTDLQNGTAGGKLHGYNSASDTIIEADVANNAGYVQAPFIQAFALRPGHAPFMFGGTTGMRIQVQGTLKVN